jgi:hypothetical protein
VNVGKKIMGSSRPGPVLPGLHDGDDLLKFFGACGVDEDLLLLIPSVNGEYGAATKCGGALCPDLVRGGSAAPGHFFCSSCILSSGAPTMWYLSQLIGGHRTMFCGCGIEGNWGGPPFASGFGESLRASGPFACSSSLRPASVSPASVGVRMSWYDCDACARCSWSDRTNACGSETAAALSSSSAFRSRLLFSRCICRSDIADRSAIASGLSLSDIATGGGCCLNLAVGGGAARGRSVRSTGASWAAEVVGVSGDTGGGVGDFERSEVVEASLDETGRVSTRSAGMAVRGHSSRRNAGESCQVR